MPVHDFGEKVTDKILRKINNERIKLEKFNPRYVTERQLKFVEHKLEELIFLARLTQHFAIKKLEELKESEQSETDTGLHL